MTSENVKHFTKNVLKELMSISYRCDWCDEPLKEERCRVMFDEICKRCAENEQPKNVIHLDYDEYAATFLADAHNYKVLKSKKTQKK
jgi:hypothetical protein